MGSQVALQWFDVGWKKYASLPMRGLILHIAVKDISFMVACMVKRQFVSTSHTTGGDKPLLHQCTD